MNANLTNEQIKEANDLSDKVKEILTAHVPKDIPIEKIAERMAMIGFVGNLTRTTILGSAVYAANYAPVVGVSKESLLALVGELYDAVAASPSTPQFAQKYAESNLQAKLNADLQSTVQNGQLIAPGSGTLN